LSTKPNRKATQSHTHPLLCLPYYSIHYVNLSEALSLCAENVALNLSLFSQLYVLGYAFPEIAPGPSAEPFVFSLIGNACRAWLASPFALYRRRRIYTKSNVGHRLLFTFAFSILSSSLCPTKLVFFFFV
jgi:hypothetical protein